MLEKITEGTSNSMLSIIIPAYNEEETIGDVLYSLTHQYDHDYGLISSAYYRIIVVVSVKTTDHTIEIVKDFMANSNVEIILTFDPGTGFVDARLSGIAAISSVDEDKNGYFALCDADLIVPNTWVNYILCHFSETDDDVISFAGTFPLSFWKRVPLLAHRYFEEVGTIFFDKETIEYYGFNDDCLFNEKLFEKFGRPLSGGCYAIRLSSYHKCGGYVKEFKDAEQKYELDGPTWRMMFRMQRMGCKVNYCKDIAFKCSARRMLADPYEFFSIKPFDRMNELKNFRNIDDDAYENLEKLAPQIDFEPVRFYVIEYYIFLWLINDMASLKRNEKFFGDIYESVYKDIHYWNEETAVKSSIATFNFAKYLRDKYADDLLRIHTPRRRQQ